MRNIAQCIVGALLVAGWLGGSVSASAQESGKQIFQQTCAACHTIGGGRLVGPDLKGVTERRNEEWLVRFISQPDRMRQEDPIAVANLKEFGVPMPALGLNEQQVTDVIAYLKTTQAAATAVPVQYLPTLALGLGAAVVLTLIGLIAGRKKVNGGMS